MIEIKNVSKIYNFDEVELKALNKINLNIERGEFVVILGQSGCGKSTLLNILGGMDKPTEGEVIVEGKNLALKKTDGLARYRREKIGMIFQKFNLINDMSIIENIMIPLKFSGMSEKKQQKIAMEMLKKVGLGNRAKSLPSKLSGGQQQRVAIARALVNNPEILLCDEPTGNLDSKTGDEIISLLQELNREGHTVIMVTHNQDYGKFADRVVRMLDGDIIENSIKKVKKEQARFESSQTKTINQISRFRLAVKNLKRRKLRFFLTSFGVAIGAMAIVILVSFGAGLQQESNKQLKDFSQVEEINVTGEKSADVTFQVGVEFAKGTKKTLNDQTIADLKAVPNVADVYTTPNLSGEMKYNDKTSIVYGEGLRPLQYVKDETKNKINFGSFISSDDDKSVVIPFAQAEALGFSNPQEIIGKTVKINVENKKDYDVVIIGVYGKNEKMSYATYFSNKFADSIFRDIKAEELAKPDPSLYDSITVRAKDSASVTDIKNTIDQKGYGTHGYADIAKSMNRVFVIMQIVLGVIGGIALLVASLGIINTMLMAILERTKEIGIMKAVGARARDIRSIFIGEAFLIGLFGGVAGLILGYGGSRLASLIVNRYLFANSGGGDELVFYIPLYLSLGVVIFSVLVSSVAGYLPAKRAAKLDPVSALRDE